MMTAFVYDRVFVERLLASYRALTGHILTPDHVPPSDAAEWLYDQADFAVLAHDAGSDPRFVYANRFAQRCFERSWAELVGLPSRLSAEPAVQAERARMLADVAARGYADGYRGVRISKSGRRFWIEDGSLWNVLDAEGAVIGQAARFLRTSPA